MKRKLINLNLNAQLKGGFHSKFGQNFQFNYNYYNLLLTYKNVIKEKYLYSAQILMNANLLYP